MTEHVHQLCSGLGGLIACHILQEYHSGRLRDPLQKIHQVQEGRGPCILGISLQTLPGTREGWSVLCLREYLLLLLQKTYTLHIYLYLSENI